MGECRWCSIEEPRPATFLLAQHNWHAQGTVAVLLHGHDPASERLLASALHFAEANDARLIVLCKPELAAERGFKSWLDARFTGHEVKVELDLIPADPAALYRYIAGLDCRLVAIEATAAEPDQLRDFVAKLSCDVLVVR